MCVRMYTIYVQSAQVLFLPYVLLVLREKNECSVLTNSMDLNKSMPAFTKDGYYRMCLDTSCADTSSNVKKNVCRFLLLFGVQI